MTPLLAFERPGFNFLVAVAALSLVSVMGAARTAAGDDAPRQSAPLQSEWVKGHASRTRVSVSHVGTDLYAFVEIQMEPGWKTYWRNPGESGIPPRFDFARSKNVAKAEVLYPAPMRIADPGGDIVGYKDQVIFPVKLIVKEPSLATAIGADVQFGICKDICVPSEAALNVVLPQGAAQLAMSEDNLLSLKTVPVRAGELPVNAYSSELGLKKSESHFLIEVPCTSQDVDAFVEAPDGLYFPLLSKSGGTTHSTRFEADLSKDVDLAVLNGKTLTITTVGACGASEYTQKFEKH
jgi:DsbC/DsbD-like thiol-disulfide interchange protein